MHDQEVAALGPEEPGVPPGDFHRAGQPCTVCHGPEGPAQTQFSVAGTIFWQPYAAAWRQNQGELGANNATISVVDDLGVPIQITTNCVGNFWVTPAAYNPAFPILVHVYAEGTTFSDDMFTQISRAGSCAECHSDPPNYNAVGHVYLTTGRSPAERAERLLPCGSEPRRLRHVGGAMSARRISGAASILSLARRGRRGRMRGVPGHERGDEHLRLPRRIRRLRRRGDVDGGGNSGVQGMLARKCGTLDCHGSIGRSLRIFSQYGLRLVDDAGATSGGPQATSPAEVFANYISAISVQPELTSKVFYGLEDPHALLLLRKPLALERHKGGQVLQSGDRGDLCLTSWLQDGLEEPDGALLTIDNDSCNIEAQLPQTPVSQVVTPP